MCRWKEADFEKQLEQQTQSPAVKYGDGHGDRQMAFSEREFLRMHVWAKEQ